MSMLELWIAQAKEKSVYVLYKYKAEKRSMIDQGNTTSKKGKLGREEWVLIDLENR